MFRLLLLLFWIPSVSASECVDDLLAGQLNTRSIYAVNYKGIETSAVRVLTQESESWVLNQSLSVLLAGLNETSRLQLSGGRLHLLHYVKEQTGLGARKTEILVDSASQRVRSIRGDKGWDYTTDTPLLDPLSHTLQLQIDRHCGETSEQAEYRLAGTRSVKRYEYQRQGSEPLDTPWGKLEAERWQRQSEGVRDTLWLLPEQDFALVRFEHEEKGEISSLVLKEIR